MEMFTAAAAGNRSQAAEEAPAEPAKAAGDDTRAELAGLKAQLAELQKQLDRLSS
jgi:hypothetical protein